MRLTRLLRYFTAPVRRPTRGLGPLLEDPHRIGCASLIILFLGIAYAITVLVAYTKGFGAIVPPWLAIPAADYYVWEALFVVPVFFLLVIVLAGVARLAALIAHGSGSFEANFALFGVATSFPLFLLLWVPETTFIIFLAEHRLEPLEGIGLIPIWADVVRQVGAIVWGLVVAVIGLRSAERLRWGATTVVVLLSYIPYGILTMVFIR